MNLRIELAPKMTVLVTLMIILLNTLYNCIYVYNTKDNTVQYKMIKAERFYLN